MVQVTFDTNNDSLEELQHALQLLEKAIMKRCESMATPVKGAAAAGTETPDRAPEEETAIDTPFLKITVKNDDETPAKAAPHAGGKPVAPVPTLNELLSESITEDELHRMFKESAVVGEDAPAKAPKTPVGRGREETEIVDDKPFIEIIEYSEDGK